MEIVIRPVSDRFMQERVLPFLTRAMGDAPGALEALAGDLCDEQARFLSDRLLSTALTGGLNAVDPEPWAELVDRLVFLQWNEGPSGWQVVGQWAGYAGDWDEALHLVLMLEDPAYPYWNAREARAVRDRWRLRPVAEVGLASLVAGHWEPFPDFPPDQVFSTQGRGEYTPRARFAFADWSWRPARTVAHWNVNLARKLERLLTREQERLRLPSLPERDEVLAYWNGKSPTPPPLTVAFSGLGQRSTSWVLELGVLASHVREAAKDRAALSVLVTKGLSTRD
ncbi:hypothetical protein P2318_05175 [Myxococcaceae bacterium GXIMD 01537]